MSNKITLEALEVLDAIARKGSFAAAAAALYRVPSALTYTIQKLEEDLGVTVFRKQGRRSVLTPAGNILLEQGRDLLTAAERLVETTRQTDSGWESCLNITIDTVLDFEFLCPHLQAFFELKSDVEINLHEEVMGGSWEAIIEGRTDLIVGAIDPPKNTQGLRYEQMMTLDWDFVVCANHPLLALQQPLREEDITDYRAVVVRDSSQHMPPLTRRVFDKQARLRVPTLAQKIDAQQRGLGVGFLPRMRIQDKLDSGELIPLSVDQCMESSSVYMAWKTDSKGKALHWFLNRLRSS